MEPIMEMILIVLFFIYWYITRKVYNRLFKELQIIMDKEVTDTKRIIIILFFSLLWPLFAIMSTTIFVFRIIMNIIKG